MKNSNIEWCDHTFNPWIGCTKVSAGCAHCYAETLNKRWKKGANWGEGAPRTKTSPAYWTQPERWDGEAFENGQNARVFCASMADWLDDGVPARWLLELLYLIFRTPHLDWLLLTKRPQNWRRRCEEVEELILGYEKLAATYKSVSAWRHVRTFVSSWRERGAAPLNVWLGASAENQTMADERIPALLSIPAKVHFLSCEPLLGPIDLLRVTCDENGRSCLEPRYVKQNDGVVKIDWVIVGGESGAMCRPMDLNWAATIHGQCAGADVAFFMKQLGGNPNKRHSLEDFPECLRFRQFPR